jgi:hypothetical protein
VHTRCLTRVPLIVRWPGVAVEGRRVSTVASLIDIMPTLLDAAGAGVVKFNKPIGSANQEWVEARTKEDDEKKTKSSMSSITNLIPYGVQGVSLRSVVAGEREGNRSYALIEHRHEPYSVNISLEGEATVINKDSTDFHMKTIITDRYRFTYMPGLEYAEYFDLASDPEELYNLWPVSLELREQLYKQLLNALIETEDPLPKRQWLV